MKGPPVAIAAIPVTYNGTTYRSGLEADWAATFDSFNWYFEYEEHALVIDGETYYLCDFRLPGQNVWAEAKGPHNERINKTHRLFKALRENAEKPGGELVVILRAADSRGTANWEHVYGDFRVTISQCSLCNKWSFTQPGVDGDYCRSCHTPGVVDLTRSYLPAIAATSFERNWAERQARQTGEPPSRAAVDAAFAETYGRYGRLPFVRAPRNSRWRAA